MNQLKIKRQEGEGSAIALVVVALLIAGIIYFVATDNNNDIVRSVNRETIENDRPFDEADGASDMDRAVDEDLNILSMARLNIENQQPGNSIIIESAFIERQGYVVVYATDSSENMNEMLGQSVLLTEGEKSNLQIDLSRPVQEGEQLMAVIYEDNGDSILNTETDVLVLDADDNVVNAKFMITINAEVTEEVTM